MTKPVRVELRGVIAAAVILCGSLLQAQNTDDPFDPNVALGKAWALITSAIESGTPQEQNAALSTLAGTRIPRGLELLERAASDPAYPCRKYAIGFLPVDDARYLPLLTEALKGTDREVRREAIRHLGRVRDEASVRLLQQVMFEGDKDATIASGSDAAIAASSLRQHGAAAFGALLQVLDTGAQDGRRWAIWTIHVLVFFPTASGDATKNLEALRRLRPAGVLVRSLSDSDATISVQSALVLAKLGSDAGADVLTRAAAASDQRLGSVLSAFHAMAALSALGRSEYLAALAAAFHEPNERIRMTAESAMQAFPIPAFRVIWVDVPTQANELRFLLFERSCAPQARPFGPADAALLRAGLDDADAYIRLRSAEELLAFGPEPLALDALERVANEERYRSRALSLLQLHADAKRNRLLARRLMPTALQDLVRQRSTSYIDLSVSQLISMVGNARDPDDVPFLNELGAGDPFLYGSVANALVAIGNDTARRALILAMNNPQGTVRIQAAGALVRFEAR